MADVNAMVTAGRELRLGVEATLKTPAEREAFRRYRLRGARAAYLVFRPRLSYAVRVEVDAYFLEHGLPVGPAEH